MENFQEAQESYEKEMRQMEMELDFIFIGKPDMILVEKDFNVLQKESLRLDDFDTFFEKHNHVLRFEMKKTLFNMKFQTIVKIVPQFECQFFCQMLLSQHL